MDEKELAIISHLRKDARTSLVEVAKETGMPVSTVYDKVRKQEKSVIKKHTCLLDFQKLGYNIRVWMFVRVSDENQFRDLAKGHHHVNSAFKLNNSGCFVMDCVFKQMSELEGLLESLDNCGITEKQMHFVSEEIVYEKFLEV